MKKYKEYVKRTTIYLETSIFGFYFDENPRNILKRESVKRLFAQIKAGLFIPITSPITVKELSKAPSPLRESLLSLLSDLECEIVGDNEEEIESLSQKYIREGVVPEKYADDARHIAYAVVNKVDVLVSYNLEHIANEWKIRRINSVNIKEGYPLLSVRTPEEVIRYEY